MIGEQGMSDRSEKTNAMRILDARGVPYTAHYFSPQTHTAIGVANTPGLPPAQVFKTLVVMPAGQGGRPLLAIVSAHHELDLKKLAKAGGMKRLRMATHREAEALTGLRVGGISALALLQKRWKVYLDASAQEHAEILVSAGQRGINLQLTVGDLVEITAAKVADISRPHAAPLRATSTGRRWRTMVHRSPPECLAPGA